jgi:hypothetical protein
MLFFATAFLVNIVFSQHQGRWPLYLVRDLHYRESFYGGVFVLNTLLIVGVRRCRSTSRWRTGERGCRSAWRSR